MADAYRMYGDSRHQSATLPLHLPKRPRFDYEMPSGHGLSSYYARVDDRGGPRVIGDGHSFNASYDRYTAQILYGDESGRSMSGGLGGFHHIDDARFLAIGRSDPAVAPNSRSMGIGGRSDDPRVPAIGRSGPAVAANSDSMVLGGRSDDPRVVAISRSDPAVAANSWSMGLGGRSEVPLPPDARSTLFVEGLPENCTCREVARYKEVRLINKESRHSGRLPAVLCFVEFQTPAHAATAMDAVQGYTCVAMLLPWHSCKTSDFATILQFWLYFVGTSRYYICV